MVNDAQTKNAGGNLLCKKQMMLDGMIRTGVLPTIVIGGRIVVDGTECDFVAAYPDR